MRSILLASALLAGTAAVAQTQPSVTLYELPAYLGRSVTVSTTTPDLASQGFAGRARSAKVVGEWQICPAANFAGACRTVSADMPVLGKGQAVSLRPAAATDGASSAGSAPAAATGAGPIDLEGLDVGTGTDGQDVTFYARPTLSGSEVSAGTNDLASASAFCKLAGASSATAAGRARTQASNLVDVVSRSRVRGYGLRDVLCRR